MTPSKRKFLLLLTIILMGASANAVAKDGPSKAVTIKPKDYLTQLANVLRSNYFPPQGTEMSIVEVCFTLNCNGTTSGILIEKPPLYKGHRMALADKGAKLAIENSAPLPKPIDSLPCPIKLKAIFDGSDTGKAFVCKVESTDRKFISDVVGYNGK